MRSGRFRAFVLMTLAVCLLASGCARAPRRAKPAVFAAPAPITAQAPGAFYHTVQKGQTIYRIAKNYNMDWHEIMAVNRISDPSQLAVGQQILIPGRRAPESFAPALPGPLSYDEILRRVGPRQAGSDWRTITVHHSGTAQGSASVFDRDHTRRHMGGLFYHFVIGNGTKTGDGALEVGFRWRRQIPANRANDIQICLVGNFNEQYVSESQFSTLVSLIHILQQEYGIPVGAVRRHEDIKGKHTACPGQHFPFDRLINELSKR